MYACVIVPGFEQFVWGGARRSTGGSAHSWHLCENMNYYIRRPYVRTHVSYRMRVPTAPPVHVVHDYRDLETRAAVVNGD